MNNAMPTPISTFVTGPENELAAVSRNGVLVPPNWLAMHGSRGAFADVLAQTSEDVLRWASCRDCCWEICFSKGPVFS